MPCRRPLLLVTAVALLATACAPARPPADQLALGATRVVATPIPTPTPMPMPAPAPRTYDEGPLENSGGRLRWVPSRDAGPWPTNGSVRLPTIGQHAPVVKVGVGMSGEMVVPRNARDVAWLDQGPYPGDTQNPVLAGHIAYGGRLGTFNRLLDLKVGDPVEVTMDGVRYTYRVIWVRLYDRNTDLVDKLMGYTEVPSVTLITCGGVFERRAGTHSKRAIARAQLESTA